MNAAGTPMVEVLRHVRQCLAEGADEVVLVVGDPDLGTGRYPGAQVEAGEHCIIHRPWSVWTDLAGRLHLRLATPERLSSTHLRIRLVRPVGEVPEPPPDPREKYGSDSWFAEVRKGEDPTFVLDLGDALERAALPPDPRVLVLGVNRGDEIELIEGLLERSIRAVGLDHCPSALADARRRFSRHRFIEGDLSRVPELDLGVFDLVVAVDVLHSPGVPDRPLLHHIVQQRLTARGAVILGVPNCTYQHGERLPGARTRNFTQPELSLLVKTVAYYRRYLHQHRFEVFVTGQHEVLVTGVRRP